MSSPLPPETITLNAAKLRKNNNKKFTTLRKCDETELTVIYHNYMASASKKQDYISLSGCPLHNPISRNCAIIHVIHL